MGALPEWDVGGGGGGGAEHPAREGTRERRRRDVVNVEFSSGGTAKSRELFMERLLKSHGRRALHSQNVFVRVTCHRGIRSPLAIGRDPAFSLFFLGGITRNARWAAKRFCQRFDDAPNRKAFAWNGYLFDFRINEQAYHVDLFHRVPSSRFPIDISLLSQNFCNGLFYVM